MGALGAPQVRSSAFIKNFLLLIAATNRLQKKLQNAAAAPAAATACTFPHFTSCNCIQFAHDAAYRLDIIDVVVCRSTAPSAFTGYAFHVVEAVIVFANEVLVCFLFPLHMGLHRIYHIATTVIHEGKAGLI
jgi:hypothetical protein